MRWRNENYDFKATDARKYSAMWAVWLRESTCLGVRTSNVGAAIAALVAVAAGSTEVVG